jgi:hypothetical protein
MWSEIVFGKPYFTAGPLLRVTGDQEWRSYTLIAVSFKTDPTKGKEDGEGKKRREARRKAAAGATATLVSQFMQKNGAHAQIAPIPADRVRKKLSRSEAMRSVQCVDSFRSDFMGVA